MKNIKEALDVLDDYIIRLVERPDTIHPDDLLGVIDEIREMLGVEQ